MSTRPRLASSGRERCRAGGAEGVRSGAPADDARCREQREREPEDRVARGERRARRAPETAARVEAAIASLGFTRNEIARSLRDGRAGAVGLVIEDLANPFYSAIARAVEQHAHDRGHVLLIGSCEEDPVRERALVLRLLRRWVDALLIVPGGQRPSLPDARAARADADGLHRPAAGRDRRRHRAGRQRRRRRAARSRT